MAKDKQFYITTAIDYVNAAPHIGHAYEKILADVVARWHRLLGEKVLYVTGTDENAQKNAQAAKKAKMPVKKFVDKNSKAFIELCKAYDISNDDFTLFEWKPPKSFKSYILDLNIVKENTENDIFFHINKGNMKIVYIRKNNLLYTIGAENEVQFQILEALIEYIDKRFHEVFAVDVILSYENVNPIAFKNFKDEMDQIIENIDALNILRPVDVFCRICKRKLSLHLKKSLIEEATSHPVPIVFTHEGHAIVCYIDQNFVVRGVEFVATTG